MAQTQPTRSSTAPAAPGSRGSSVAPAASGATPATTSAASTDVVALVRHGIQLRSQGHDDEALAEFQRAYALSPTPRVVAQIALAEQAVGHWLDADEHLRAALAASTDHWIVQNHAALESAQAVIQQHIGRLEIRGGVPGAEIVVASHTVGTLPLQEPIRVLAGSVAFEVRAPGFLPQVRVVIVTPGELAREDVQLSPVPVLPETSASASAVPPPSAPAPIGGEHRPTISPLVWAGGGALLAGGIGILVVGLVGNGINAQYRTDCSGAGGPTSACADGRYTRDQSTLNTLSATGDVLIGVAAAGAIALGIGVWRSDFRGSAVRATTRPQVMIGFRSVGVQLTW